MGGLLHEKFGVEKSPEGGFLNPELKRNAHSFFVVCCFSPKMRVFEGGAKILRFGGLKSFPNPVKINENRSKNVSKKTFTF